MDEEMMRLSQLDGPETLSGKYVTYAFPPVLVLAFWFVLVIPEYNFVP